MTLITVQLIPDQQQKITAVKYIKIGFLVFMSP
jgi:hypothetical protein